VAAKRYFRNSSYLYLFGSLLLLVATAPPVALGTRCVTAGRLVNNNCRRCGRKQPRPHFRYSCFQILSLCVGSPLWSSKQSSWLQIHGSGFDSRRYQIFWREVGLERGSLSLVSTTEELLERQSSGSSLESQEHGRRDPSRWPRGTLYQQKLVLISPTSGGRSVGIVRSWTQATELLFRFLWEVALLV
jgi:hypothetical protein